MTSHDVIILGAGGAGLFCAGIAAQRGRRVLVVDHAPEPGRKIVISGGGRCNFTNVGASWDRYVSVNPQFARSALGRTRVASSTSGRWPNQRSKPGAAWCSNIPSPSTMRQPRCWASVRKGVISGV